MSKQDVDKILLILEQMKKLGVAGKLVMKDGKVDLKDLPVAISLLSEVQGMIEAFKAASEAFDEAKDIDAAEGIEVVQKLYEVGQAIEAA